MQRFLLIAALVFVSASSFDAEARGWVRRGGGSSTCSVPAGCSNATAQGVAEACAKIGRLCHMGGHSNGVSTHEGLGMAGSKDAAYRACCFATSSMKTVDVGYAQTKSGMWICCRRYR